MKICHLTSVHKPDDIRIFNKECSSLAVAGHEVYILAVNCKEYSKNRVNVISLNVNYFGRLNRILKIPKLLLRKAITLNADIYHLHDPELLQILGKLKKSGKKVIYDAHEDLPRQILSKYYINKFFRKIVSWYMEGFENRHAAKADAVVGATDHIGKRFSKINANTVVINNYPILENNSINQQIEKKNEICYIGGLFSTRGIIELVKSLEHLDIVLNLAGNYSPESLRDELVQLSGWNKVKEWGFVGKEKVMEIYQQSKIGMVTLHPTPAYIESLPVKLFEYMNAGIPVIASDFPLWKEIVYGNDCGICVDPLHPEEIAKAINELLNDTERSRQMGINGRDAVIEKYNWAVEEKKLISLYQQLSA
jgi:glycosyltransferase involved in cell wall biosynthesis